MINRILLVVASKDGMINALLYNYIVRCYHKMLMVMRNDIL